MGSPWASKASSPLDDIAEAARSIRQASARTLGPRPIDWREIVAGAALLGKTPEEVWSRYGRASPDGTETFLGRPLVGGRP